MTPVRLWGAFGEGDRAVSTLTAAMVAGTLGIWVGWYAREAAGHIGTARHRPIHDELSRRRRGAVTTHQSATPRRPA